MNGAGGSATAPKVSVLALLARICTAALARFPELNSTVDTEAREIVRLREVHLGFAAQTDRGLVVPVVRDAHSRNVESIGAEIARLTEAARAGKLTPAELTGGTFTLNNYGVFGVDGSTPIINLPEVAMLGVGRIVPKPWVHQGSWRCARSSSSRSPSITGRATAARREASSGTWPTAWNSPPCFCAPCSRVWHVNAVRDAVSGCHVCLRTPGDRPGQSAGLHGGCPFTGVPPRPGAQGPGRSPAGFSAVVCR